MKKITTKIRKNNKTKTIYAIVDDETAELLENSSEKVRHEYIVSEHKIYLNNLKETRRHQSIGVALDNGLDYEDDALSPEEKYIEKEKIEELHKAISLLSEDQKWLVNEVFFKGRSQVEIARELGIDPTAIRNRLKKIYEKIKKFCI